MSEFRIVSVDRLNTSAEHCHVTDIEATTAEEVLRRRWSAVEVRAAISNGDGFYTISPTTSEAATVEAYDCPCGLRTIRSGPDAIADNNLAVVPKCSRAQSAATRLEARE